MSSSYRWLDIFKGLSTKNESTLLTIHIIIEVKIKMIQGWNKDLAEDSSALGNKNHFSFQGRCIKVCFLSKLIHGFKSMKNMCLYIIWSRTSIYFRCMFHTCDVWCYSTCVWKFQFVTCNCFFKMYSLSYELTTPQNKSARA